MRRIHKILALSLAILLFGMGLLGCGAPAGQTGNRAEQKEEIVNLPLVEETEEMSATEAGHEETESEETESEPASAYKEEFLDPDGSYSSKEEVALYLHQYGKLPSNYISKKEAEKLGWSGGSLEPYAPGKCIGGSNFGNYEGILPKGKYTECDIDTLGAKKRGAKRIVFSTDGDIYYTEDHYESFTLLYTADGPAEEETVYH